MVVDEDLSFPFEIVSRSQVHCEDCEPGKIETARGKESSCIACPIKTVRSWSAPRPRWRLESFLKGPATNSVGDEL